MAAKTFSFHSSHLKFFPKRLFSFSSNAMAKHYDIIVAGSGMVGTAMACSLGKNAKLASKKILILDGGPKPKLRAKSSDDPYSNRVVSLNPGTKRFFQSLHVWDHIEASRFSTVKKMQIWDSCSEALITFDHPGLLKDISYIVENDIVLYALGHELHKLEDRVDVKYKSKILNITLPKEDKFATIKLENETENYTCNLLIGAEGFNSPTRLAMGAQWLSWSYKQSGVVATLQLAEPTENIVAWQRFLPSGPIALLPLTNDLSSLVWSTNTKAASELVKMTDESFVDAVNDALWKQHKQEPVVASASRGLGQVLEALSLPNSACGQQLPPSVRTVASGSRASFPLGFGHAARYVAPSVALIGDAAHRVHPLAGQGVNLGFGDVECLTSILAAAAFSGEKIGSLAHLHTYERQRQCHNFPTMIATDVLQKLYNTSAAPVVLLRSLGMQFTHSLQPLKRAIMEHAST